MHLEYKSKVKSKINYRLGLSKVHMKDKKKKNGKERKKKEKKIQVNPNNFLEISLHSFTF